MLSPVLGPYCSSHTKVSIGWIYCTTWSQQNVVFGLGLGNSVLGSMKLKVLPPSGDMAAYQLPVKKTTSPFTATLGSPTLDATCCCPGPSSAVLIATAI